MPSLLVSTIAGYFDPSFHRPVALQNDGNSMKMLSVNVVDRSVDAAFAHPKLPVIYLVAGTRKSSFIWATKLHNGKFELPQKLALTSDYSSKYFFEVDAAKSTLYVAGSGGSLCEITLLPNGSFADRALKRTRYAQPLLSPEVRFSFSPDRRRIVFAYTGSASESNYGGYAALDRTVFGRFRSVPVVPPAKQPVLWEEGNLGALHLSNQWAVFSVRSGGLALAQWRKDRVQVFDPVLSDKDFVRLQRIPKHPLHFIAIGGSPYDFQVMRVKMVSSRPALVPVTEWSNPLFVHHYGTFDPDTSAFYYPTQSGVCRTF